jgi:hypothetical protein
VASNARLEAQGFDGVIQFVASGAHYPHPDTMTQLSKGSMLRWGNIIDDDSVRFALMPDRKQYLMMPGGARQYGDVLEMAKSGHVAKANITDTVAGIPCEVWRYEGKFDDGRPDVSDVCIATNAGLMQNRLGGHTALYHAAGAGTFQEVLKLSTGILRHTDNGVVTFVVLSAQPMDVPDSIFLPPRKYKALVLPKAKNERKS